MGGGLSIYRRVTFCGNFRKFTYLIKEIIRDVIAILGLLAFVMGCDAESKVTKMKKRLSEIEKVLETRQTDSTA